MKSIRSAVTRREFFGAAASFAGATALSSVAASNPASGALQAGAAASDITPKLGVLLDGTITENGPVKGVHDALFARALVLDNGSGRLAIATCDATVVGREVFDRAKELVHDRIGLAPDRMLMAASHSHSAIRALGIWQGELDIEYLDVLAEGLADAITEAAGDLAPAQVGWGVGSMPELVFNRRWFVKPGTIPPNPFGETTDRVRFNPPRGSEDLVRPAGPVDPDLSVLSLRHADGHPLALLANLGIHYCGGFERGQVSADYFGLFGQCAAELLDATGHDPPFVGMMTNGTSGDISNGLDFRKPAPKRAPYAWMQEVAERVAQEAVRVVGGMEYEDRVPLAMEEREIELGVRRPDEKRLAWACQLWEKAKDKPRKSWPEIYAREAIGLSTYPSHVSIKLQALRIGELGIAAIPCEVFAETGLAVKAASPLEPTLIMELANGYGGYLPTPEQHALGGYETWPARSSYLEVEAEPKIRQTVLDLLKGVAGAG